MTQPAEPEAVRAVSERLKANSGGSGQAEPLPPSCFPLVITRTLVAITKVETLNPGTFAGVSWPFCRGVLGPLLGWLCRCFLAPLGLQTAPGQDLAQTGRFLFIPQGNCHSQLKGAKLPQSGSKGLLAKILPQTAVS